MSEALRYVTLDAGGRPSVLLDLNDATNFAIVRDSFTVTFGQGRKQAVISPADRRYGGERQHGEVTANGQLTWSSLVMGATADVTIATVENLLGQFEDNPYGLLLEWRPDGATQSALYEIRGTASWECKYQWVQFAGAQSMVFDVSVPVAPLARGLPLDIGDSFDIDTRVDYTYDSGTSANEGISSGFVHAAANVSTENRAIHTARGYTYADNQQTIGGIPLATITGWKNGVVLKRTGATTYLECYVDDEGTNSRLRIDKVIAGVRTNVATTNLAARVKNEVGHWVRGRIEGNVVTAEYFTAAPRPMSTPATTNSHTLTAGAEIETFGAGVKGAPGRVWIPKTVGAALYEYAVEPYTYRAVALPAQIALGGTIPGSAPALADIQVTNKNVGASPRADFALLGWHPHPPAGLAVPPFGLIEGETGTELAGWAAAADATARGGNLLKYTAAGAAEGLTASFNIDPSVMTPDEFTNEIAIEVWGRFKLAKLLVEPRVVLRAQAAAGVLGQPRYTDEWGTAGKVLGIPNTAEASAYTFARLGTLRMLIDLLRPLEWALHLEGSVAGGTGVFNIDYLLLVPAASRACSPSSKRDDTSYPRFNQTGAEMTKTVRHDLSGLMAKPPERGFPDHGLGGQLIEFPPGLNDLIVKLSEAVPEDPEQTTSDTLAFTGTVHAAVTPRWYIARSGS